MNTAQGYISTDNINILNESFKTKMLTIRIPKDIHNYLKMVAQANKSTVQQLCATLIVSCASGMIKHDKEKLDKLQEKSKEHSE